MKKIVAIIAVSSMLLASCGKTKDIITPAPSAGNTDEQTDQKAIELDFEVLEIVQESNQEEEA